MDKRTEINDICFAPRKNLDGLFASLRHLRHLTADLFNNGPYYLEILDIGSGYAAALCEYSKEREALLKTAATINAKADSGSGDELVERLYQDLSTGENAVAYLFESFGTLHEYYIIPGAVRCVQWRVACESGDVKKRVPVSEN